MRVESEKIIESSVRVCIPPMRANIKNPSTCATLLYAKDCKCKKQKKTTKPQGLDTRFDHKKKDKVSLVYKDQTNSSQSEDLAQFKEVSLLEVPNKQCNQTSTTTTVLESNEDQISANESKLKSSSTVVKNSAEKFFLESGILGTMGLTSSILKKSSKINPILNDSNIKEVVSVIAIKCKK